MASGPSYHVVVYIDEMLVRVSLILYSLATDGYAVLGDQENFFRVEGGDVFWRSESSSQAFYESLQAGEVADPKLTLFQESWEMLLSTLEINCP